MSFELRLSPGADSSRDELEAWLDAHPLVERQDDDSFFYENGDTFTSCSLTFEGDRVAVGVSYLRPFAFAEEVSFFLGDLCAGTAYGPFERASFLRDWLRGNVLAYEVSLTYRIDETPTHPIPPHVEYEELDAIWSWNLDEQHAGHDGGIRVAPLQLAESDEALFTLGIVRQTGERLLVPTADTYAVFVGEEPVRFVEDEHVTDLLEGLPAGPDYSMVMEPDTITALWERGERKGISTLQPHEVWETELVEHVFEVLRTKRPEKSAELAALREQASLDENDETGAIRTQLGVVLAVLAGAHGDAAYHVTPTWLPLRWPGKGEVTLVTMKTEGRIVVLLEHKAESGEKRTERAALDTLDAASLDAWIARLAML